MMMPFNDWRKRKAVALSPKLYSLDEREVTIRTGDWFEKNYLITPLSKHFLGLVKSSLLKKRYTCLPHL